MTMKPTTLVCTMSSSDDMAVLTLKMWWIRDGPKQTNHESVDDNEAYYVGLYHVLLWWHGDAHTQDVMDQRWT